MVIRRIERARCGRAYKASAKRSRVFAMLSPLDGSGIDLHKPPLLLDRLCTSLEFVVQTRFAGTT